VGGENAGSGHACTAGDVLDCGHLNESGWRWLLWLWLSMRLTCWLAHHVRRNGALKVFKD
jgi:hypothetical protein